MQVLTDGTPSLVCLERDGGEPSSGAAAGDAGEDLLEGADAPWKIDGVKSSSFGARLSLTATLSLLALATVTAACSSEEDPPRNGVNDVRKACEIRAGWVRATTNECLTCQVGVKSPSCDCEEFKAFAGLCKAQEDTRVAEPSCTAAITDCTNKCSRTDCGCVEGCYALTEACERAAAAVDGCAAEACAEYCR